MSKKKGRRLHSDLIGLTANEVAAGAGDRSLSAAERARYREHEKALRLRNRQKRNR